jgi:flavin reductase (DIM6/NTAB) family NADH-FMN oxidoreductase RutF
MDPVDVDRYREAVGRFPTGITVLTTHADGVHHGMTANSFTSVSLDPVLVLVCVQRTARLHDLIMAAGEWGVSVLAASAVEVSRLFANPGSPLGAALPQVPHHFGPHTGAALLPGALATLECRTVAAYGGGDHTILLGSVLDVQTPADGPALAYFRGRYRAVDH